MYSRKTSVPIIPSIYPNVSSDVQRFFRHYQTALFFQEWYPDWSNLGMSCHAASTGSSRAPSILACMHNATFIGAQSSTQLDLFPNGSE